MTREVFLGMFLKTKIFYFCLVFSGIEEKCEMNLRPDFGKLAAEVYQMWFLVRSGIAGQYSILFLRKNTFLQTRQTPNRCKNFVLKKIPKNTSLAITKLKNLHVSFNSASNDIHC